MSYFTRRSTPQTQNFNEFTDAMEQSPWAADSRSSTQENCPHFM